jgi:hypothetical protein
VVWCVWAFTSPLQRIFESKIRPRFASIKSPCDHLQEKKKERKGERKNVRNIRIGKEKKQNRQKKNGGKIRGGNNEDKKEKKRCDKN